MKKMVMVDTDKVCFREAIDCHICGKKLGNDRVRDHCHLTDKAPHTTIAAFQI